MIHLRLSDSTQVDGTATHRFWSVTRGDWFGARDLRVGESLLTPSGTVRVDEARVEAVLTPVFNLEVEGAHEFFVGDAEVLAHNGCPRRTAALGVGETLLEFAENRGIPWGNWRGTLTRRSTSGRNFGRALTDVLRNAEQIAFNLDGMPDLRESFRRGQRGFRYVFDHEVGDFVPRNATNTELATVIQDPSLLGKTTFYRDGRPVLTQTILEEIGAF